MEHGIVIGLEYKHIWILVEHSMYCFKIIQGFTSVHILMLSELLPLQYEVEIYLRIPFPQPALSR